MRRGGWLLGFLLLVTAMAADGDIVVTLTSPPPATPVFGEVEMIAEVTSTAAIKEVVFWLDDRVVGVLDAPPYRLRVAVGDRPVAHRFEVVAEDVAGERARAILVTPGIDVDLEVDLELQQLYVTVSRNGRRFLGLEADDFTVFDQDARQRLVTFERGDVPLTAVLLVDSSDSMRGAPLDAAVSGARAFITDMQELDQAKLMLFSDGVIHATPFTNFAEILATGLAGVEARGSTALNDYLYLAVKLLEARQGRRVVVLLSDGIDVGSVLRMAEVRETARRSRALIYWIRLGGANAHGASSSWRDAEAHGEEFELLRRTVEESGGRILELTAIADTAAAFVEILDELRQQYVLGYYPSVNRGDGSWHEIKVRVRGRGFKVRTRQGYVDY